MWHLSEFAFKQIRRRIAYTNNKSASSIFRKLHKKKALFNALFHRHNTQEQFISNLYLVQLQTRSEFLIYMFRTKISYNGATLEIPLVLHVEYRKWIPCTLFLYLCFQFIGQQITRLLFLCISLKFCIFVFLFWSHDIFSIIDCSNPKI